MAKNKKAKNRRVKSTANLAKTIETRRPSHQQALQFLDNIVAMAPVNRDKHILAQQALKQLGGAITELEALKKGQES